MNVRDVTVIPDRTTIEINTHSLKETLRQGKMLQGIGLRSNRNRHLELYLNRIPVNESKDEVNSMYSYSG